MSADINSVTLVGRLTRDMELKTTNSGFSIGNIGLAVNSSKKQGDEWIEEANFFDVTLLGRRAESLAQYLVKGTKIAVSGALKQERWESEGQKRSRVVIHANNIQLLGGNQNNTLEVPQGQSRNVNQDYRPSYNNSSSYPNFDDIPI